MNIEQKIIQQMKIQKVHDMTAPVVIMNKESFDSMKEFINVGELGKTTFAGILVVVHEVVEPDTFYIIDADKIVYR